MTPIANPKSEIGNPPEALPLSLLNDFLYCPRRAALKIIEGWRGENEHTARGDIVHEHADEPGYEVAKGVTLLRALPVFSERLGLSGKCDVVEVELGSARAPRAAEGATPSASEHSHPKEVFGEAPNTTREARVPPEIRKLCPVEFKKGRRREFENDDVQLCAQALCLEEMFQCPVEQGAVFHAASKRRRRVEFDTALRSRTQQAVADLRSLLASQSVPPALYIEGRCEECSLYEICLPRLTRTEAENRNARLASQLFQI